MASGFQKLILFPQAFVYAFGELRIIEKIFLILILSAIYILIISPLLCKFYIVPKIEKKIGKKLGYSYIPIFSFFGRYLSRDIEITTYILDRYYAFKKYRERGVPFGRNNFALKHAGYTIDMVSKAEIIYSFSVRLNLRISGILLLIVLIAVGFLNSSS